MKKILIITKGRMLEFKDVEQARKLKEALKTIKCPFREILVD